MQNGSKLEYAYFVPSLTIAFEQISRSKSLIASFYNHFNLFSEKWPVTQTAKVTPLQGFCHFIEILQEKGHFHFDYLNGGYPFISNCGGGKKNLLPQLLSILYFYEKRKFILVGEIFEATFHCDYYGHIQIAQLTFYYLRLQYLE